jgi:uncharacterized membrane protein YccC
MAGPALLRCVLFNAGALRNKVSEAIPPLVFGVRLSASVCLALYIAFWLQLDSAYWAGTSAAIVCQPSLGASLRKGWFRLIGTVLGALVIVVLTACFIQNRGAFLIALALWGAGCTLVATLLRNFASYSAALAGYTAAIIASAELGATGGPDSQVFMLAAYRASEIAIGIVSAGVVLALTDFGGARQRLASLLAPLAGEITDRFVGALADGGPEGPDAKTVRRELIRRVIALDPAIDQAIGESSELRYHSPLLQRAIDGLFGALASWRTVANHLTGLAQNRQSQDEVRELLERFPLRAGLEFGGPRWLENPLGMRRICRQAVRELLSVRVRTPSLSLLVSQTSQALFGVSDALSAIALTVADPARSPPRRGRVRLYVVDWFPALLNAGRAFITIGAVELFWVLTGWPTGAAAITWAAISVVLFGPKADQGFSSALSFLIGTGLAVVFAAIASFALLPQVETFLGFYTVMAGYLIPAGALSAQRRQTALFGAMAVNFTPLIAPLNVQSYDTIQFYNSALALFAGAGFAAISFLLLPPLSPAFTTRRLLGLALSDLRRLAGDQVPRSCEDWERRVFARLSSLPDAATPLERARLLAALSAGSEIIRLRRIASRLNLADDLEPALNALARGHGAVAIQALKHLDRALSRMPKLEPAPRLAMHARGSIMALSEVLEQHSLYFDGGVPK